MVRWKTIEYFDQALSAIATISKHSSGSCDCAKLSELYRRTDSCPGNFHARIRKGMQTSRLERSSIYTVCTLSLRLLLCNATDSVNRGFNPRQTYANGFPCETVRGWAGRRRRRRQARDGTVGAASLNTAQQPDRISTLPTASDIRV